MKFPNSFGSVYKLSGNRRNPWVARKTVGWKVIEDTKKSYPIYKFIGYYPSRQAALTALVEYNKDPYDISDTITFKEVYEQWSAQHYPKVSESNRRGCTAAFNTCAPLHDMVFSQIKVDHMQEVLDNSGKNSPTLKKIKILLGLMYDYAVLHDIVTQDKRDKVRHLDIRSAGNPNARNRTPFSAKEVQLLWDMSKGSEYVGAVLIMIYTGVRISELLDLKAEDVHLSERWFYVRAAKTEAGIREVPIAEKIVPFMEHWLDKGSDYLICTADGNKFSYRNYLDSYWIPVMDELSLTHRPHDTRHTCVSMLTEAGVDERIIKKIVGHRGQGVTETVYTHIELSFKLDAINKI